MKKMIPLLFILLVFLTACRSTGNRLEEYSGSGRDVTTTSTTTTITLYPAFLQLPLGQHITLVSKTDRNHAVTWSSSNPSVATVDENGRIIPIAVGETIITVTLADNAQVSDACGVLVVADGNIFLWEK